jgi:hypothetical protein
VEWLLSWRKRQRCSEFVKDNLAPKECAREWKVATNIYVQLCVTEGGVSNLAIKGYLRDNTSTDPPDAAPYG